MPFTLSHAATVLPFSRRLARFHMLSAAIIGSMVPDFGFFSPWPLARDQTHSAAALLSFCLPIGLASYWLFQWLIKTPVLEILPDNAYSRSRACAAPADVRSARQWLFAAGAILAGAVTHLIWDAFTHEGARGVRMVPELNALLFSVAGHHVQGYKLLQQLSSLAGLTVVAWFALRALCRTAAAAVGRRLLSATERRAWFAAYVLAAVVAGAAALLLRSGAGGRSIMAAADDFAIAALRGMAVSVLGISVCIGVRLRVRRRALRA